MGCKAKKISAERNDLFTYNQMLENKVQGLSPTTKIREEKKKAIICKAFSIKNKNIERMLEEGVESI